MMGLGSAFKTLAMLALIGIAWSAFKGYGWIHELPLTKKLGQRFGTGMTRWIVFGLTIFILIWWLGRMI